jgi:probable HAF family extracellular repeat protein
MKARKAALFLAVLLIASVALAQGTYIQIDVPGSLDTWIFGINTAGDMVGQYVDAGNKSHGFLLSGGVYITIDYPAATSTSANGINDVGQIVGSTVDTGFRYDVQTQTFTEVKFPGNGLFTVPFKINNAGTIVGWVHNFSESVFFGFSLTGTAYRKIVPPGYTKSSVSGINNPGEIVGSASSGSQFLNFLLVNGKFRKIQLPPGAVSVLGINDTRAIVGSYIARTGNTQGFLLQTGAFQPLVFPGSSFTISEAINNSGEVVGQFKDDNFLTHGFTWTKP